MYNKRDVERADAAVELFRRLGYPSEQTLIRMLRGGTLLNCDVTVDDIQRAIRIYGKPLASIKDKHTKTKLKSIDPVKLPIVTHEQQHTSLDIMHVREMPFLVTLVTPLNLILTSKLDNRKTDHIWRKISFSVGESEEEGLQGHGSYGGSGNQSFWRCGNRVEACCGQSTRGGTRTQNSRDKGTLPWYNQYTAIPTVQDIIGVSNLSRDKKD